MHKYIYNNMYYNEIQVVIIMLLFKKMQEIFLVIFL